MRKYIFITGGVLSSLGKGITAGGIAALLEAKGLSVSLLKLDPYLNLDPGTMSPYQHGEVFVTDDGAETDLDLGHYERFSTITLTKNNCATAGKLYADLFEKERKGTFLGQTVQTVPHFTNEIKEFIYQAGTTPEKNSLKNIPDVTIVEIGGTVGDIESLPFLEAIRQIHLDRKNNRCVFVHVTYVPYLAAAKELKTKPTQHSVKALLSLGIQPHIIVGRAEQPLPDDIKKKIALFTNVDESAVISNPDLKSIYEIPLVLHSQKLDTVLDAYLELAPTEPDLHHWQTIIDNLQAPHETVNIAIVGKYIDLQDAYKSISEALVHAQIPNNVRVAVSWIDAELITPKTADTYLKQFDALLIPGGFGSRGIEGKIETARYAREHQIPYFGICLGMQIAVIEFARHVLGLTDAHSTEFDATTANPVVDMMAEQKHKTMMGGTMRLGAYPCTLTPGSKAHEIYGKGTISERHRHRYEFNTTFVPRFVEKGFLVTGYNTEHNLPEIIEIPAHPFFCRMSVPSGV